MDTPEVKAQEAGGAMLLLISTRLWELLILQGNGEGLSPGDVLERSVRGYIEENGTSEAKALLERLDGQPVAQSVGGARR
jgi:hypothetical protein